MKKLIAVLLIAVGLVTAGCAPAYVETGVYYPGYYEGGVWIAHPYYGYGRGGGYDVHGHAFVRGSVRSGGFHGGGHGGGHR